MEKLLENRSIPTDLEKLIKTSLYFNERANREKKQEHNQNF